MTIVQIVTQHIQDPCLNTAHIVPGFLHALRHGICNGKADINAFSTKAIGILLDTGNGAVAVLLPNQNRLLRPNAIGS